MRVLLQHAHAPGEISGVVTYCEQLQPALVARGHAVRVFSTHGASLPALWRAASEADLVHLNSHHFRLWMIARALGKPVVLKYHYPYWDSTLEERFEPVGLWRRFWRDVEFVVGHATKDAGWTKDAAKHVFLRATRAVMRVGFAFVVERRLACSAFIARAAELPLPVEVDYCPAEFPATLQPSDRDAVAVPAFAFVGRLEGRKGCDVLLRAAAQLRDAGRTFHVLVIGDGPERAALEALAARENLRDCVTFTGRRSRAEVLQTMRGARAAIVPSTHNEALSYVVMEAAMEGCPAIGSRSGGIPELIGPDGLLFERGDHAALAAQMAQLLDQPGLAAQLGERAYRRLRGLCSTAAAAARTERVYREVLEPAVI